MIKIRSDHLDGHKFGNFDADRIGIDIGATNHMSEFFQMMVEDEIRRNKAGFSF